MPPFMYHNSLFFLAPMEEAGPFKAGLFTSNPEDRWNPNHQSHQILHQKEDQVWTTHLRDLEGADKGKHETLLQIHNSISLTH